MRGIGRGGARARPRQIVRPYQANDARLVGSPVAECGWTNQWPGFGECAGGPGANQYRGDHVSDHRLQSAIHLPHYSSIPWLPNPAKQIQNTAACCAAAASSKTPITVCSYSFAVAHAEGAAHFKPQALILQRKLGNLQN
jgi:hypothetical protein